MNESDTSLANNTGHFNLLTTDFRSALSQRTNRLSQQTFATDCRNSLEPRRYRLPARQCLLYCLILSDAFGMR